MAPLYSAMNREGLTAARGFFERAVSLDSANVDALAGLALADMLFVAVLLADDGPARLAAGEQTAMKALALAPNHANAHYALGYIYLLQTAPRKPSPRRDKRWRWIGTWPLPTRSSVSPN